MNWSKKDNYHMESSTGYRVSKVISLDLVVYCAWGKGISRETMYSRAKAHYGLNEAVPVERRLIGVYQTVKDAQAACEQNSTRG